MKAIIVALLAVALCYATFTPQSVQIVNEVNANPEALWRAEHNQFSTWSDEQLRGLCGTIIRPPRHANRKYNYNVEEAPSKTSVPDSFDSRTQWPNCIHPIRDQAHCGSCWAFAGSEVLSDRFCIASNGSINVVLSPQDMVSCDAGDMGCNGGMLGTEWSYMVSTGIVTDACFPYVSGGGMVPNCPTTCPGKPGVSMASDKHRASSYKHVGGFLPFGREKKIQEEIQANGPVEVAFSVYRDFITYKSGVYHHTTGALLGGHAVKMIGWGVDQVSNTPYWIVANSWNTTWGMNGFFWIKRGNDECGIESQVYAGTPLLK